MNANVLFAVFKRNFVSYFANPLGYVFICVFVLLSGLAAFWPDEFFNANLANLNQLTLYLPGILLIFVPAITMSIWAQERAQGTDELLLTIPAGDSDVVLGKYLAAVAIYSVSLLFSMVCNLIVLEWLGAPDLGLFFGTYAGYWLIGLAMLGVGMVASFLTGNLTIAFIVAALINGMLVIAVYADRLPLLAPEVAAALKQWSVGEQLRDFSRGVIGLSAIVYFLSIAAVSLYVSAVLLGRRHWGSAVPAPAMTLHYVARAAALVVILVSATLLCRTYNLRIDATSEGLNSLSPYTRELLSDLDPKQPVRIEAFISPQVPESFVQTRTNLVTMLQELQARGKGMVEVRINDTEPSTAMAGLAERRFGIASRRVPCKIRGAWSNEEIYMGVAMTSGLKKVVVPFIGRGIPVEYELVRSTVTVSQHEPRKKIGVLASPAQVLGGFDMQGGRFASAPTWPIVEELKKQYEVEAVDWKKLAGNKKEYAVLLAVQPSSMSPGDVEKLVSAVERGVPALILEDPFPVFVGNVPGSSDRPRPQMGRPPAPKADLTELLGLLQLEYPPAEIVWQDYNPYRKFTDLLQAKENVFVDKGSGAKQPFGQDPIGAGFQHMLLPYPGSLRARDGGTLTVVPLAATADRKTGTVAFDQIIEEAPSGNPFEPPRRVLNPTPLEVPTNAAYWLAVRVHGEVQPTHKPLDAEGDDEDDPTSPEAKAKKKPAAKKWPVEPKTKLNAVFVADIDLLAPVFADVREQGEDPEFGIRFDFDNVPFILNAVDALAGEERYLELRKRRPAYRTLTRIEERTKGYREELGELREKLTKDFAANKKKEQDKLAESDAERGKDEESDQQDLQRLIERAYAGIRMQTKLDQLNREYKNEIRTIKTDLTMKTREVQDQYKLWAVLLPPIPPLVVACAVFFARRSREREGVARSRLR